MRLLRKQCCFSQYMVEGFVVWSLSLTLPFTGLVWQLMRAYTLSILRQLAGGDSLINDAAIIEWANAKVNQHVSLLSLFSSFSFSLSLRQFRNNTLLFDCFFIILQIHVYVFISFLLEIMKINDCNHVSNYENCFL